MGKYIIKIDLFFSLKNMSKHVFVVKHVTTKKKQIQELYLAKYIINDERVNPIFVSNHLYYFQTPGTYFFFSCYD